MSTAVRTHHMWREIVEQPEAVRRTVEAHAGSESRKGLTEVAKLLADAERLVMVAHGASRHAALAGRAMLEAVAALPADVSFASEYRLRPLPPRPKTGFVFLSQSGETADTLAAMRETKARGAKVVAVSNVAASPLAREADYVVLTHAGAEVSVPATKSFTTQLAALFLIAVSVAHARGRLADEEQAGLIGELQRVPALMQEIIAANEAEKVAMALDQVRAVLFAGAGVNYAIAMEGALKLKEAARIPAEGFPLGEVRHGSLALLGADAASVIVGDTEGQEHTVEAIRAAGKVIVVGENGDLKVPKTIAPLAPLLTVVPLQMLAYHAGARRGLDVDRPPGLVKAV
jgi:glucosamine--fructose-6-phosphate aminotransferase (isomerizing)